MPTCFICKEILKTIKFLYIHFEYKYQSQLEFYECVESDCHKRKFDTFESLKRHLNLHHYSQESQKSITQDKNIDCDNINLLNTFESIIMIIILSKLLTAIYCKLQFYRETSILTRKIMLWITLLFFVFCEAFM